jgi:hypothetical protein
MDPALLGGDVNLGHLESHELIPGGVILEQSWSCFLGHSVRGFVSLVFVEQKMQSPKVVLDIRSSRVLHRGQESFLFLRLTPPFDFFECCRDLLGVFGSSV